MFGSGFNQQNQQSAFGSSNTGFGSSNNTGFGTSSFGNTGFNSQQNNNNNFAFGQSNFGSNNNSAFGSNTANTNTGFGSKPFGQTTSLFNSSQPTTSFGFNSNNNASSSAFGSANNAFGGGTKSFLNSTSAFGSNNTNAFGTQNNTAFGGGSIIGGVTQNQGTGNPPFSIHSEKEPNIPQPNKFYSITAMPAYRNFSFEELRIKDYQMNKKYPTGGFGSSSTSTFGNNFGSSLGTNSTGFGQKPAFGNTISTFGSTQPQMNAFGSTNSFSNNNNTGLLGSQQNTGFGTTNNTGFGNSLKPTTSAFGGFNTGGGFGSTTTPATSAFGTNTNQTTTGFGGTTNSSMLNPFGAKTITPATSTGFGLQVGGQATSNLNKPGTTGLFNQPFSGFGNTNTTTTTSGGLFGNTQPLATNTGTGLFGSNTTGNTTNSLFGNKTTTLGGGLNLNKPIATTMSTTVKPAFSFTTPSIGTSFGNQGTSLFQNKAPTTGLSTFNTKAPAATNGLFGQTTTNLGGINTGIMNQAPLQAAADQSPYGINPLFESVSTTSNSGVSTTRKSEISKTKKTTYSTHYKITPKTTTHIKLQGFSAPSPGIKPELGKKNLFDGKHVDDPHLVNKFVTRKSIKKLIIAKDDEKVDGLKQNSIFSKRNNNKKINFNENLEVVSKSPSVNSQKVSTTPFNYHINNECNKFNIYLTPTSSTSQKEVNTKNSQSSMKTSYINDYVVSPSLSEMNRMSNEELRHVNDLIVTYPDIGSVHFLEPVDLISASPTNDRNGITKIFGSIIIIEPKVCTVYPGEKNKPPVGQGLNVSACINLLQCWVMDKSTQKPITDEENPRFKRFIRKLKQMPDTKFISYDIETGSWTFQVEHFSKYGLKDDDDDDDDEIEMYEKSKGKVSNLFHEIKNTLSSNDNTQFDSTYDELEVDGFEIVSVSDEENKKEGLSEKEKHEIIEKLQSGELELEAEGEINSSEKEEEEEKESEDNSGNGSSSDEDGSEKEDSETDDENDETDEERNDNINNSDSQEINNLKESEEEWENSNNELYTESDKIQVQVYSPQKNKRKYQYKNIKNKRICNNNILNNQVLPLDCNISNNKLIQNKYITQKKNMTYIENVVGLSKSISNCHENNFKNIGLAMGRSFRVGWGPGGILITKRPNIIKKNSDGSNIIEVGKLVIHHLNLFEETNEYKNKEAHRITLQKQLDNTKFKIEKSNKDKSSLFQSTHIVTYGIPKAILSPKIYFESFVNIISGENKELFSETEHMIWKLCEALFDPIIIQSSEKYHEEANEKILNEERNEYFSKMFKKERISHWLQEYIENIIETKISKLRKEIKSTQNMTQLKELNNKIIFEYLSGRKLISACQESVKQGNIRMATIFAQCGSCFESDSSTVFGKGVPGSGVMDNYELDLINNQIEIFEEKRSKSNYIKLWKLIGGQIKDICHGMNDWKRTLALFLWFSNGGTNGIKESIEEYEDVLKEQRKKSNILPENVISEPIPHYFEKKIYENLINSKHSEKEKNYIDIYDLSKEPKHFDILYHLLKYYVNSNYSLTKMLSPQNITSDIMDNRISWLLYMLLSNKINDNSKLNKEESNYNQIQDKLTISLVFQLENLGMWDWACYVSMFLTVSECREKSIRNLICRYYPLDDVSGSIYKKMMKKDKEINNEAKNDDEIAEEKSELWTFLVDHLKIPKVWIHEARAIKAYYENDIILETISLLDAGYWNEAHYLIVNKLGPEAIINKNYEFLKFLLNKISYRSVRNWSNGGGLYLSYINLLEKDSENGKTITTINDIKTLTTPEYVTSLLQKVTHLANKVQKKLSNTSIKKIKGSTTFMELSYEDLLKLKVCYNEICETLTKILIKYEKNKKEKKELFISLLIPEDQRLCNVKKITNEWFDSLITV